MALIGTIRKNFWFVLIVLGLALVAFLFMDIFGNQSMGGGSPIMGKVGDTEIGYNEFRSAESSLYRGSSQNQYATQNVLWNYFVEKALVNKEADALGIDVGREELRDLHFGANLHPRIQNQFRNPQTGQIDRTRLNEIKDGIDSEEYDKPEYLDFRRYWAEQEFQIKKEQKQSKLNAMVSKAMFTPTWMVNQLNQQSTSTMDFDYVKIPFDYIPDSDVTVSDQDITSYLKSNAAKYTNENETRRAEYFVFDVIATPEDSMANKESLNQLKEEFKNTSNDSLFATNNNGNYLNYYAKADEMPDNLKSIVPGMEVGSVYGPFIDQGLYTAIKLIDRKVVPDSVKARHILRSITPGDFNGLTAAKTLIDSIYTEVKAGRANFSEMAKQFSQDPGSASDGGAMPFNVQGAFVPEFNNVCFFGNEGDYEVVTTQYGVHLVNVMKQKYLNREAKYKTALIRVPIMPSQDTQDNLYSKVTDLVSANKSIEAFKTAVATENIAGEKSVFLDQDAFQIGALGGEKASRDIVKWLFDTDSDVGEVSAEVYTYTDPNFYYNNKYVVAALDAVSPKGLSSVESARSQVEFLVKNQMKGQKIIEQASGDINAIAQKFGQTVQNIPSATLSSTSVGTIGNEPKVLNAAFNGALNTASNPIIGNSGVYVVLPKNKVEGAASGNIPSLRAANNTKARSRVTAGLIQAMRKKADVKDSRLSLDF